MKANLDIRSAIVASGIKQWEVAEALRISEEKLSRILRKELPDDRKQVILQAISDVSAGMRVSVPENLDEYEIDKSADKDNIVRTQLIYLVKQNDITYAKVASSIGITNQHMSKIIHGRCEPNLTLLCKFADYFDVSTDYLLGRETK